MNLNQTVPSNNLIISRLKEPEKLNNDTIQPIYKRVTTEVCYDRHTLIIQ